MYLEIIIVNLHYITLRALIIIIEAILFDQTDLIKSIVYVFNPSVVLNRVQFFFYIFNIADSGLTKKTFKGNIMSLALLKVKASLSAHHDNTNCTLCLHFVIATIVILQQYPKFISMEVFTQVQESTMKLWSTIFYKVMTYYQFNSMMGRTIVQR